MASKQKLKHKLRKARTRRLLETNDLRIELWKTNYNLTLERAKTFYLTGEVEKLKSQMVQPEVSQVKPIDLFDNGTVQL